MTLVPLERAEAARCGAKAARLGVLARAGVLAVAPGICLPFEVFRAALAGQARGHDAAAAALARWRPDAELSRQLEQALARLAGPGGAVVARSSASCEDGAFVAAGVFRSVGGVRDAAQLVAAIRAVWSSLLSAGARALLADAGRAVADEAMAVLLQRELSARRGGHALLHGDGYVEVERVEGHPSTLAEGRADPERFGVAPSEHHPLGELVREAGLACAAAPGPFAAGPASAASEAQHEPSSEGAVAGAAGRQGPVEVEWLEDAGGRLWVLQVRPLRDAVRRDDGERPAGRSAARRSFERAVAADATARGRRWRWDDEHNPDPLSPAHASLMTELPGAEDTRVYGGFLYVAEPGRASGIDADGATALARLERLEQALEAAVARARAASAAPSDTAGAPAAVAASTLARVQRAIGFVGRFLGLYDDVAGARRALVDAARSRLRGAGSHEAEVEALVLAGLRDSGHQGHRRVAALAAARDEPADSVRLARLALYRERFGRLAPVWDIAEPTLGERSLAELFDAGEATARAGAAGAAAADAADGREAAADGALADGAHADVRAWLARARRSGEDDDLLFAEALWLLRRALLDAGASLCATGALLRSLDVFMLPLARVREALEAQVCGEALDIGAAVGAGRARWRVARSLAPPERIGADGRFVWPEPPVAEADQLAGLGVGGVARGRVRKLERLTLDAPAVDGRVLVCATVLPATAPILARVAALVTERGGALSHAACLARELGVPAVLGARGALGALREGEHVEVDGARGRVLRRSSPR